MKRGCDMEDLKELQIKCEEQEATYQFSSFSRDDAWLLGGMPVSYTHLDVYKRQQIY